jgi:hypothetical protein
MREIHAFCVKISPAMRGFKNRKRTFIGVFSDFGVGIGIAKLIQQSVLTVTLVLLNLRPCPRKQTTKKL